SSVSKLKVIYGNPPEPGLACMAGSADHEEPRSKRARRDAPHALLCAVLDSGSLPAQQRQDVGAGQIFRPGGNPANASRPGDSAGVWDVGGATGPAGESLLPFSGAVIYCVGQCPAAKRSSDSASH